MKVTTTVTGCTVSISLEPENTTDKNTLDLLGAAKIADIHRNGTTVFTATVPEQSLGRASLHQEKGDKQA